MTYIYHEETPSMLELHPREQQVIKSKPAEGAAIINLFSHTDLRI